MRYQRQCIEACSVDQSEAWKKIFAFIFQLSGWALVAPSCFALQVPGVRGLQARGHHVHCFFLAQLDFAHERNTCIHRGYTRSRSRSQAVQFQEKHGIAEAAS